MKKLKFDKGWKLLIYFDIILPALLFVIAFLTGIPSLSKLFHSYELFIVSPIPNLASFIGIIGLIYHLGIILYTVIRRDFIDLLICIIITLAIATFFLFEINYLIIKPLNFATF